jgi:hypothetical protein
MAETPSGHARLCRKSGRQSPLLRKCNITALTVFGPDRVAIRLDRRRVSLGLCP